MGRKPQSGDEPSQRPSDTIRAAYIGGWFAIAAAVVAALLAAMLTNGFGLFSTNAAGTTSSGTTPLPSSPDAAKTPTASSSNPTSSAGSRKATNPGLPPPSKELRKLLVVASDLPSGWTPTDPYGWSDLIIGGFNTCQGAGSNQSIAAPSADGKFASVLTAFNAPQGSADFILQNIASFISMNAAKGYLDQLHRQIASCPNYSIGAEQTPRLRTIPSTGDQSLAFTEGNGAYDSYVIVTSVGNIVCSVADGSYLSPTQASLAQYLNGKTVSRISHAK